MAKKWKHCDVHDRWYDGKLFKRCYKCQCEFNAWKRHTDARRQSIAGPKLPAQGIKIWPRMFSEEN